LAQKKRSVGADWKAIADRANAIMVQASHGESRGDIIRKIAEEEGIGEGLLRRALAARRFIDSMKKQGHKIPKELLETPAAVLDIIARWANYDPVSAFDAAVRYQQGDLTVRALYAEEAQARPAGQRLRPARLIDVVSDWKHCCIEQFLRQGKAAGFEFLPPSDNNLPIDGWLRGQEQNSKSLFAIRIVGPYQEPERYASAVSLELTIALGLNHIGYDVIVVIPGQKYLSAYQKWLDQWKTGNRTITLVSLPRPPILEQMKRMQKKS